MANVVKISGQRERKRFSDFAKEPVVLEGSKVSIETILGEEIQILGYRTGSSKFEDSKTGAYTTVQFAKKDGAPHVFFTSSTVLTRQCIDYAGHMPFWTSIQKVGRYYTMS